MIAITIIITVFIAIIETYSTICYAVLYFAVLLSINVRLLSVLHMLADPSTNSVQPEISLNKTSLQDLNQTSKEEINQKSSHCQTKSDDIADPFENNKKKIEPIIILDSDEESDEPLSNQFESATAKNQVSSPPFRITSSDKKADQTQRTYDIQGNDRIESESIHSPAVTPKSRKSVKLFDDTDSDSTLTLSDDNAVETSDNESPGQCSKVSLKNLNPSRQLDQYKIGVHTSDRSIISSNKDDSIKKDSSLHSLNSSPIAKQDVSLNMVKSLQR